MSASWSSRLRFLAIFTPAQCIYVLFCKRSSYIRLTYFLWMIYICKFKFKNLKSFCGKKRFRLRWDSCPGLSIAGRLQWQKFQTQLINLKSVIHMLWIFTLFFSNARQFISPFYRTVKLNFFFKCKIFL